MLTKCRRRRAEARRTSKYSSVRRGPLWCSVSDIMLLIDIGKDCRTARFTWTGQQNASYGTARPAAWSAMRRFIKLVSILLRLQHAGQPLPQSRCTDHLSQGAPWDSIDNRKVMTVRIPRGKKAGNSSTPAATMLRRVPAQRIVPSSSNKIRAPAARRADPATAAHPAPGPTATRTTLH